MTRAELESRWTLDRHGFRCVWSGEWFLEARDEWHREVIIRVSKIFAVEPYIIDGEETKSRIALEIGTAYHMRATYADLRAAWLAVTEDAAEIDQAQKIRDAFMAVI